ncbi:cupredoxin domain-containing protein [archaeon]|nr:cupredoxin domain-containing protein [archaeon]
MKKYLKFFCMAFFVFGILACSQQPVKMAVSNPPVKATSTGPLKEVHIAAFDWGFKQDEAKINKGDHVKLILTSSEGTHGIMIPDLGVSSGKFSPGEEQVVEFDAEQTGTFDYFCNVPCGKGHKSMKGQLVIE